MPTLSTLADTVPLRVTQGHGGVADRQVLAVWPADHGTAPPHGWSHTLAAVTAPEGRSAAAAQALVRSLAREGAVAVVVADPAPDVLVAAAERAHLPVAVMTDSAGEWWSRLARHVSDARVRESEAMAHGLEDLLRRAQRLGSQPATAEPVLQWLTEAVGGFAVLVMPDTDEPPSVKGVPLPHARIAEVAAGGTRTVEMIGPWEVRLFALSAELPSEVLVVGCRDGWRPSVVRATAQAVRLLSWWERLRSVGRETDVQVRLMLLQLLMTGQVLAARRAAHPMRMCPGVMLADRVRLILLGGSHTLRELAASKSRNALGGDALIVNCPVDDSQVVVIAAADDGRDNAVTRLRNVLDGEFRLCLGASLPVPLDDVATAHSQATRALAAAAVSPRRSCVYEPDMDIARLLPPDAARRWARETLRPLSHWRARQRSEWIDTVRLYFAFGAVGAGRLTGLHRNTITRRVEAVAGALKYDLDDLSARVRLDLALRVTALYGGNDAVPDDEPGESDPQAQPLTALLTAPEAASWADELMGRLDGQLRAMLVAWIDNDQLAVPTAARLGIHPQTLLAHLHRAGGKLNLPLFTRDAQDSANGVNGVHDLVLAQHITGDRRLPCL